MSPYTPEEPCTNECNDGSACGHVCPTLEELAKESARIEFTQRAVSELAKALEGAGMPNSSEVARAIDRLIIVRVMLGAVVRNQSS